MILRELGIGIVGGFVIYLIGCTLLDAMVVETTMSADMLTYLLPLAIAGGVVIGLLKHIFTARNGGGRQ